MLSDMLMSPHTEYRITLSCTCGFYVVQTGAVLTNEHFTLKFLLFEVFYTMLKPV